MALRAVAAAALLLPAVADVPTVEISPGVKMPMIAFGSYRGSLTNCSVVDGVKQWLQLGGRHLDSANDYGTEPDVGQAIKESGVKREEIFITTKIPGPIGKAAVHDLVLNSTLPKLGVDYVDLVLIHFPCHEHKDFPNKCGAKFAEDRLDTWRGLAELRAQGKLRAIGVSNYLVEQVQEVVDEFKESPAVNQVQFHLGYHDEPLLSGMKKLGTTLEAWASLAGPTSGTGRGIPLSDERLKKVAAKYGMSTAQLELRWETMKGVVPVTATCSKDHAVGDLESFKYSLSQDDIKYLDTLKPDLHVLV